MPRPRRRVQRLNIIGEQGMLIGRHTRGLPPWTCPLTGVRDCSAETGVEAVPCTRMMDKRKSFFVIVRKLPLCLRTWSFYQTTPQTTLVSSPVSHSALFVVESFSYPSQSLAISSPCNHAASGSLSTHRSRTGARLMFAKQLSKLPLRPRVGVNNFSRISIQKLVLDLLRPS